MIFFAYLMAFGIYLLITAAALFYVPTRFKEKRQKLVVFLVSLTIFVLTPAGWIYYEWSYFDSLCEKEAGVKIYRTVEGVEGFYLADSGWGHAIKDYPYSFIEARKHGGKLYRFLVGRDRSVLEEGISEPKSKYAVTEKREQLGTNVERVEYQILKLDPREVLAVKKYFVRGDNWFKPWLSSGYCENVAVPHTKDFIMNVLKPATSISRN